MRWVHKIWSWCVNDGFDSSEFHYPSVYRTTIIGAIDLDCVGVKRTGGPVWEDVQ